MRTIVKPITPRTYQQQDLGITDNKGRAIGLQVSICTVDVKEAPEGPVTSGGCYICYDKEGLFFSLNMMVTKNGASFGPSQCSKHYSTIGEVQDAIDKRKKQTIARYKKQSAQA